MTTESISDKDQLLPCPFCGGEANIDSIAPHKHHIAMMPPYPGSTCVECHKCDFRIIGSYKTDEALKKWNTRTDLN